LVRHRQAAEAEQLVRQRAEKQQDNWRFGLLEWLFKRANTRKDAVESLELTARLFCLRPNLQGYQELQKLAGKQGRWESLRAKLIECLKTQHDRYVLVEIYLKEGDIDAALETVKGERSHVFGYGMDLKVAKAAEATRPREALAIYRKHAEQEIAHRGRHHYQEACKFLKKVAGLYQDL